MNLIFFTAAHIVLYFGFVTKIALVTHWCFGCCPTYLHSFLFFPFSIPQVGQGGQEAGGNTAADWRWVKGYSVPYGSCSAIKMGGLWGCWSWRFPFLGGWLDIDPLEVVNELIYWMVVAFVLPPFISLSFIYQTVFIIEFCCFCLPCSFPHGEQVAGWSIASGWGQFITPPLVSLKKRNSDEDNEQKFWGKRGEHGKKNPFPCPESREHYEIIIWWLFQTTGHVRNTRSQLRFRGWKGCLTVTLLHSEEGLGCLFVDLDRMFHLLAALSLRQYNNILCKSW